MVVTVIGLLTSENTIGLSSKNCLGIITEYDYTKNGFFNPLDPPPPYIHVDCFAFPSKEDAESARLLLAQLVGTDAVGRRWLNTTYEILLSKNSVDAHAMQAVSRK
jgi:hypothetical protein